MESISTAPQNKTKRAGLLISVSKIERRIRKGNYAKRIKPTSAVYMAGVLEYLCAELLELSGNAAADNKRVRITPRHIMMAVQNDAELKELLKDVQFPESGVLPFIHPTLLKAQSGKTVRATAGAIEDEDGEEEE